jgi:acid stress-induced BolA-like protein IbaG/YrbA
MEKFIQKLTALLLGKFKDAEIELEVLDGGRITGFVVWDGFEGKEQIKRQGVLWRELRASLTAREVLRIAGIFTLTSLEMANARAG